jgi:hypothetical protein
MKECEKLHKVHEDSQKIGEFLAWLLYEKDFTICHCDDGREHFYPIRKSIETLLAEYFEIDLDKVEREKRRLLSNIRAKHEENRVINYGRG